MTPFKKIVLLLLPFFLISCWGQEKNAEKQETGYKTIKAKDSPEVRERLEAFNAQEHRLEFTGCELRYNGKAFFFGDSLEEVEAVLGDYDGKYGLSYVWKNIRLQISLANNIKGVESFSIYFSGQDKYAFPINSDYVLFDGIPMDKDMVFKDLIDSSNYEFKDFEITNISYLLSRPFCKSPFSNLEISFYSSPPFDSKGGGHILLKGKFLPDNTKSVDVISVYEN